MFTHECFIRRTDEEIIERLKEIGHKWFSEPYSRHDAIAVIDASYSDKLRRGLDKPFLQVRLDVTEKYLLKHAVDCGDNIDLFIAVAAIRCDSDKYQWFTDGCHWEICPDDKADIETWISHYNHLGTYLYNPHKASIIELIDHFKNKK